MIRVAFGSVSASLKRRSAQDQKASGTMYATHRLHGNPTARFYYAIAVPLQRTGTTMRAFAVDQNDVIWCDATGAAPKTPFLETAALKRLR